MAFSIESFLMEDVILTIEEVAQYLKVSVQTVSDWIKKGEIPCGKFGDEWRFNKSAVERWASSKLTDSSEPEPDISVKIKDILSPDRIIFLDTPSKNDAIVALAKNLATAPQVKDAGELEREILKREELMSTALGRGIAIPHVRLPSVTDLVMSVGISKCDITDFGPVDDIPVRILFMIAAAYNQHKYYLKTLSFFATKLKDASLRNELLKAETTKDVYALLTK